jgi:transglutaminase-like putative cysteine protease
MKIRSPGEIIREWLPEREDILPFLLFFCEIGLLGIFVIGLDSSVTGFDSKPYLLIAFWGIWLPRLYSLGEGKKWQKLVFLLLSGLTGVLISTLRVWNLVGWLSVSSASMGGYLPGDALARAADQAELMVQIAQHFSVLVNNCTIWYQYISRGDAIQVRQVTQLLWGTLIFLTMAWLGWQVHLRRKPFLGVILPIVLFAVASEFSNQPLQYFGLLMVFAMFIVVVFSHSQREREWAAAGYGYSLEIRPDLWGVTALVCVMAFLISIFPPRLSLRTLLEKWELIGNEEESSMDIASGLGLAQLYPDPEDSGSRGRLPSSHLISEPPEEMDTHLFDVWVGEEDPVFSAYWRTHTYQIYTGHGWLAGDVVPISYPPDEMLRTEFETVQVQDEITVWARSPEVEGVLIHAYQVVQVDQPSDILWRGNGTSRLDYSMGVVGVPLYTVQVSRSVHNIEWLKSSEFIYPDWVTRRYLQVPADLPDEVQLLGETFADQYEDPFSRARAIESYLRGFPYTLEVPPPPTDKDVVAYFIFDLQRGYCDYFATAMAVLARSAGLPARIVGGYAPGEYQEEDHLFRVTAAEAHTWVEIYFSGIGWVEFEPTPARPLRSYLVRVDDTEMFDEEEEAAGPVAPDWQQVLIWTAVVLVTPILLFVLWSRIRLIRLSRTGLLTRARDRLYQIAEQLGVRNPTCLTPGENQVQIAEVLQTRYERRFPRFLLRNARDVVVDLVDGVEEAAFRGMAPEEMDKHQLVKVLRQAARVSRRISMIEFLSIEIK